MVGVALLAAITVLLAGVTLTMVTVVADEGSPTVQTQASFAIEEHRPNGDPVLSVVPEAVQSHGSTFVVEINGKAAYEWDGQTQVRIHCLYVGDTVTVYKRKADSTELVERWTFEGALSCPLANIDEKFEYAVVNGNQVQIRGDSVFGLELDPDGPGADTHTNVGPMPLSNPWHYVQVYPDTEIEGMEPPVWVFVMTDNVHRPGVPSGNGALNWSDPPPGDPGTDSYEIVDNEVQPTPTGSEPTNDIYMVFKPGCSGSQIRVVAESADYDNQILMQGSVVVPNTSTVSMGTTLPAPAIDCG